MLFSLKTHQFTMSKSWQTLLFALILFNPTLALAEAQNENKITVNGTNFTLNYTITGNNKITNIDLDTARKDLFITFNAQSDGNLTITLPRELIDAKINGKDVAFPFHYNMDYVAYDTLEKKDTSVDRTIAFPFKQGNWIIRVSGTQVIPEFGFTLSMVLPISVIGMIIIYSRFKSRR